MANPVQFKSSAPTALGVQRGNFYIGTATSTGYGPTSSTGYFAGLTPPSSEYVAYQNKAEGGPSIRVFDSTEIIPYFKGFGYNVGESSQFGRAFSTASQQNDICVTNKDLEPIYPGSSAGDLTLYLDGGFTPCFASGSDTVITAGNQMVIGELTGTSSPEGTTQRYSAGNGGSISFDSSNRDKITTNLTNNSPFQSTFTMEFWVYVDGAQSNGTLFYKAPSNGQDNSLEINIASNGRINITVGADTRTSTAALTQDAWNLLSIQLTSNANAVRVNNGTVDTATRTAIGSALTNITSTAAVLIGSEGTTNNFNGKIAVFSVYAEGLGQAAQLQNWDALKSRFGL
jgi:hypothetical protein